MQATEEKKVYKCQECGAEFPKQGRLNLHAYHCKNKKMREGMQMQQKTTTKKSEKLKGECEKGGNHEWRILRAERQNESQAIGKGFDEVCKKCQELR